MFNNIKNKYSKYKSFQTIKDLTINIYFYHFYIFNCLINLGLNNNFNIIDYYSYIITLKVNGTGIKNILSLSSSYIYPCPSTIYLSNELVSDFTDCHYINIPEPDIEIKLEWNNVNIDSTKRMFYNCTEITEIDLTKFDTSLVTDMSYMFSMCYSLSFVNVSNLNTLKVETFENMFFNCTSLTSLNLESFTNPSATSLYRMFYGCKNLEYINIKNFEEIENTNLDSMFYNIRKNAVICLLSCPPPTNFKISSMNTTEVSISWEGYEFNKFIISYGLQNLLNPENGNKINLNSKTYHTFKNLDSNQRYDVYIKTNCDSKSSYWIGPLLISIESYNMTHTGINSIHTCSKVIYDSEGPDGNYSNYANSTLTIYPETGKLVSIKGTINTEINHGNLSIYYGSGKYEYLYGKYSGSRSISLSSSSSLTLKFTSDKSIVKAGFQLVISCDINSKSIYKLIKNSYSYCMLISCKDDWKNSQKILLSNSGICLTNCTSTSTKYSYKGNCYNNCPENAINDNFICYSNSTIEKCGEYSFESDYEDLCITCQNGYYPILNDKSNKYDFINCYKNNSLDKYYLDKNDLFFKPCYESCKTCSQSGTKKNHNCIECAPYYGFNLSLDEYYNCYPKCVYDYYFDNNDNYICLNKDDCPSNLPFKFQNQCYASCPEYISELSQRKKYFCEIKCPKDLPYEIIEIQQCFENCTLSQLKNKLCERNFKSDIKVEENEAQEKMVDNIRKELTNGIDTSEIDRGEDIVIKEKDITITITKNDNQKNQMISKINATSIDLGECETKIKNQYNISQNESLYILKLEVKQEGYKIPKLQYEVYYPLNHDLKLFLLNLSICENTNINIYLPLTLNGNIEKFDPYSDFYNDICTTFEENGKDLTLSARKNSFINNNLTLCEENCNLENYNKDIGKAKCSCKTKTNFEKKISKNKFKEEGLYEMFTDFDNIMNIKVLKCTHLIFSINAFKENYANIILIVIIILYFICLILFIFKGYKKEIKYYIDSILYFTLFPNKILSIIQKKKREEMEKKSKAIKNISNLKENKRDKFQKNKITNKIRILKNQDIIIIKPPLYKIYFDLKSKLIKNYISNPIKKKELLYSKKTRTFQKRMLEKIKSEEKTNEKFLKNSDIFTYNLSDDQIYELYLKLYTKTDDELNDLSYIEALKYDKRTYFSFYFSLIKCNHLLFFSFSPKFDFNSKIIKIYFMPLCHLI